MPHQCTSCEEVLPNGSREMLGGCPSCGGNRFRFIPDADAEAEGQHVTPSEDDTATTRSEEREYPNNDFIVASEEHPPSGNSTVAETGESRAQIDARAGVVRPDELPPTPTTSEEESSRPDPQPSIEETPSKEALKDELEDAFGSIRIVERGEYELNLMELYERDACIIQLEEDGRYVIDVPEMFGGA